MGKKVFRILSVVVAIGVVAQLWVNSERTTVAQIWSVSDGRAVDPSGVWSRDGTDFKLASDDTFTDASEFHSLNVEPLGVGSLEQEQIQPSADLVGRFTIVHTSIGNGGNFDAECKTQLGDSWGLADFSDLIDFHNDGGHIPDLVDSLRWNLDYGDPEFQPGVYYLVVSYNGELTRGSRQYFVQRHDHRPPSNFAVHADVDNHHISLGSWFSDGWTALCYSDAPPVTRKPSRDEATLIAFYNATNGDNWKRNTNWLGNKPLDEWHGVETNSRGNVVALELPRNHLHGKIPSEINELTDLRVIDLSGNHLTGEIPEALGDLGVLINGKGTMYLSGNRLEYCIPEVLRRVKVNDFGKLSIPYCGYDRLALQALYEATNGDNWKNNDGWRDFLKDRGMRLGHLDLKGVTVENGRVTKLNLARNGLEGNIPSQIGHLTELKVLNLSTNSLTGNIPVSMRHLLNLTDLLLAENDDLYGCVPTPLNTRVGRGFGRNDIVFASLAFCNKSRDKLGTPKSPKFIKWHVDESVLPSEERAARLGVDWLVKYAGKYGWSMTGDDVHIYLDTTYPTGLDCWIRWTTKDCISNMANAENIFIKANENPDVGFYNGQHAIHRLHKIVDTTVHEAVHTLFQWQQTGVQHPAEAPPPDWFNEGMAVYFAAVITSEHLTHLNTEDPTRSKRLFEEQREKWVDLVLPHDDCFDTRTDLFYQCLSLAIELLVHKTREKFDDAWQQQFVKYYQDLRGRGRRQWQHHFEKAFGISVDVFFETFERHRRSGFQEFQATP